MTALLSVSWLPLEYLLRQFYHFGCDRMRPRIVETKFGGSFLGGNFRSSFNGSAKWITQLGGVFAVGVVDTPQLIARIQSRARSHGSSSPQGVFAKMYQLHKMRGQSVHCPEQGPVLTRYSFHV